MKFSRFIIFFFLIIYSKSVSAIDPDTDFSYRVDEGVSAFKSAWSQDEISSSDMLDLAQKLEDQNKYILQHAHPNQNIKCLDSDETTEEMTVSLSAYTIERKFSMVLQEQKNYEYSRFLDFKKEREEAIANNGGNIDRDISLMMNFESTRGRVEKISFLKGIFDNHVRLIVLNIQNSCLIRKALSKYDFSSKVKDLWHKELLDSANFLHDFTKIDPPLYSKTIDLILRTEY